MKKQNSRLSKKERLFCVYYADCADPKLSAIKAGYSKNPHSRGLMLLSEEKITKEITRVLKNRTGVGLYFSQIGLCGLAFSDIKDAVRLMYMDKPDENVLSQMNLKNISEIKKHKDGALEIKFFDRLKALDNLSITAKSESDGATSLVDALCMGAQNLSECDGEQIGL